VSFFITGTDTGVGKTFVTALLANLALARGRRVAVYKPVETGGKVNGQGIVSQDMEFIKKQTTISQPLEEMNTYCFRTAAAPNLASQLEQKPVDLEVILARFHGLQNSYDQVLVEGAGGLCVPISGTEYLITDLIKAMDLPVLVVARPNLGTINHTVLTVKYAQSIGIHVKGIFINYAQRTAATVVEKTNPHYIARITGLPILGIIPYIDFHELTGKLAAPEKYLQYEKIFEV